VLLLYSYLALSLTKEFGSQETYTSRLMYLQLRMAFSTVLSNKVFKRWMQEEAAEKGKDRGLGVHTQTCTWRISVRVKEMKRLKFVK
jgi:hypothetical protein